MCASAQDPTLAVGGFVRRDANVQAPTKAPQGVSSWCSQKAAVLGRSWSSAHPSLRPAGLLAELGRDTQGVHQLGLPGSELSEELRDGTGLDAAAEEGVQLLGACVQLSPRDVRREAGRGKKSWLPQTTRVGKRLTDARYTSGTRPRVWYFSTLRRDLSVASSMIHTHGAKVE